LKRGNQLPADRLQELKTELAQFLGKQNPSQELTEQELESICQVEATQLNPDYKTHEQMVVEQLQTAEQVEAFVKKWRHHFVDMMQPKHLPRFWQVDRPLDSSGE
jgi:hypothetical protein